MEDVNKVFWIKVFLGLIVGFILGILRVVGWIGVGVGLGIMFATYPICLYLFKINPENVGGKRKLFTNGLLQYFLLWLVIWILIYTFTVTG